MQHFNDLGLLTLASEFDLVKSSFLWTLFCLSNIYVQQKKKKATTDEEELAIFKKQITSGSIRLNKHK